MHRAGRALWLRRASGGCRPPSAARIASRWVIGAFTRREARPPSGAYPGLGREIPTRAGFSRPGGYAATALLFGFWDPLLLQPHLAERRLAPWRADPAAGCLDAPARLGWRRRAGARRLRRQGRTLTTCANRLHGDARLVPQRRPRPCTRRSRAAIPRGRPRCRRSSPQTDESLKLLAGRRHRDLIRARCSPHQGPEASPALSARAAPVDLDHAAGRPSQRVAEQAWACQTVGPPGSPTRRRC